MTCYSSKQDTNTSSDFHMGFSLQSLTLLLLDKHTGSSEEGGEREHGGSLMSPSLPLCICTLSGLPQARASPFPARPVACPSFPTDPSASLGLVPPPRLHLQHHGCSEPSRKRTPRPSLPREKDVKKFWNLELLLSCPLGFST